MTKTATKTAKKPMRADAVRNREQLLATARKLFASGDPNVSLEKVAKAAGVGVGTAYRHFPTLDDLVEATYRTEAEKLEAAAKELLRDNPPEVALEKWLDEFLDFVATKKGMLNALKSVVAGAKLPTGTVNAREHILASMQSLLDAGVAAGSMRSDVDAEDFLNASGAIFANPYTREEARRILMLIADGLRPR